MTLHLWHTQDIPFGELYEFIHRKWRHFPNFIYIFPLLLPFFAKNDHILMHPFMCARIIHHLVVVGHILQKLHVHSNWTYNNILQDFVHKLWLHLRFQIFCCCQFESDVEAEFIDLIEYTAKICNSTLTSLGIIRTVKAAQNITKDLVTAVAQTLLVNFKRAQQKY